MAAKKAGLEWLKTSARKLLKMRILNFGAPWSVLPGLVVKFTLRRRSILAGFVRKRNVDKLWVAGGYCDRFGSDCPSHRRR